LNTLTWGWSLSGLAIRMLKGDSARVRVPDSLGSLPEQVEVGPRAELTLFEGQVVVQAQRVGGVFEQQCRTQVVLGPFLDMEDAVVA
jgi:hypothetical protein